MAETLDISAVADAVASAVKLGPPPPALPQGWILKASRSNPGYYYYYQMETGMTSWQPPVLERQQQELEEEEEEVPPAEQEERRDEDHDDKETEDAEDRSSKRRKASNSSAGPKEVRVLHILKKHKDSRRPSSWRQPVIGQNLEEAKEELQGLLEILQEEEGNPEELKATFEELARTESDCSSAKRGGDLGFFGRRKMQPAFEEASFGLQIGELTKEIVETSSGVHLIYRIG
jgi:NIMA-interacting peptidyl-prolyl cis-trans isomerase 1